jgi:hypothetical protein
MAGFLPSTRRLRRENAALRVDLRREWEMNHAERCDGSWPHSGKCYCPLPDSIRREIAADALKLGEQVGGSKLSRLRR